ncbi:hypothetical protein Tco_0840116 [Tanacetum coccineum]|uniref:Uncharacterized protein n=1 Tax=Tanacetum coccineum TaxID=301880 RepID=A0ABQ5AX28_9ASTR
MLQNNSPAKVMWYFPIIPRLQRLFKLESISEDLRWHATRRITDGVLRHPADSQAWRTIDEKFPRNSLKYQEIIRLRISADGVDVNSRTRHHSVWPVLSVIYNLPPCGFKGCVVCGKDTHCVRLSASSKQSYAGHRRYLPYNHPFRRQKKAFNGQQEFQLAPNPLTGEQIYNESLVGTLLNVPGKTKDGMNARLDLAELGIKPELFARQEEDKQHNSSSFTHLTKSEKDNFVKC